METWKYNACFETTYKIYLLKKEVILSEFKHLHTFIMYGLLTMLTKFIVYYHYFIKNYIFFYFSIHLFSSQ